MAVRRGPQRVPPAAAGKGERGYFGAGPGAGDERRVRGRRRGGRTGRAPRAAAFGGPRPGRQRAGHGTSSASAGPGSSGGTASASPPGGPGAPGNSDSPGAPGSPGNPGSPGSSA